MTFRLDVHSFVGLKQHLQNRVGVIKIFLGLTIVLLMVDKILPNFELGK